MRGLVWLAIALGVAHGSEGELDRAERAIAPLDVSRAPPRPGEWLASQHEDGQSVAQFRRDTEYKNFGRPHLYVQRLGPFSDDEKAIITDVEAILAIFFARPLRRLDPGPLSPYRWREHPYDQHPQVLTASVIDRLERPVDAQAVLAFTTVDLWPGGDWNFVFGQASPQKSVGVWSIHRFGDPQREQARVRERAIKLALHETGHMFGIRHCTAHRCGMSGTMNLAETDGAPLPFCSECEHKLWLALGLDLPAITRRYEQLIAFAEAHELPDAARTWRRALAALRAHRLRRDL